MYLTREEASSGKTRRSLANIQTCGLGMPEKPASLLIARPWDSPPLSPPPFFYQQTITKLQRAALRHSGKGLTRCVLDSLFCLCLPLFLLQPERTVLCWKYARFWCSWQDSTARMLSKRRRERAKCLLCLSLRWVLERMHQDADTFSASVNHSIQQESKSVRTAAAHVLFSGVSGFLKYFFYFEFENASRLRVDCNKSE